MMTYDTYKLSGIDWLGSVPKHWSVKRIKDIIIIIGSGVTPKGGSEVYVSEGIPLLRSQNVYDDGLRIDDVSFIDEATHTKMRSSQLKPNDILINITGASIGRTCIVPYTMPRANINQHIIFIRAKKNLVPYVSNYFKTNSVKEYINLIQAGTSKEALNMGQALNIPIILPPPEEQTTIAQYLDAKTQAIDKKINLLTKKANYYKELRKSIIHSIVSGKLLIVNGKAVPCERVSMIDGKLTIDNSQLIIKKESGIDWIGKIPEHWEVKRVKDIFSSLAGGTPSTKEKDYWIGKIPWIPSGKVQNNVVVPEVVEDFISEKALKESSTKMAKKNSILIALTGATCSNIGCLTFDTTINQSIVALLPKSKLAPKYYFYFLISGSEKIRTYMTGGAQGGINQEDVKFLKVLLPPKEEQIAIANYLDEKTQKIDAIVSNIGKQIDTLKELRKTLINDVVTGKIKVANN